MKEGNQIYQDLPNIEPKLIDALVAFGDEYKDFISQIRVFGSRVLGTNKDNSDTDVMIFIKSSSPEELRERSSIVKNSFREYLSDSGYIIGKGGSGNKSVDVDTVSDFVLSETIPESTISKIALSGVIIWNSE